VLALLIGLVIVAAGCGGGSSAPRIDRSCGPSSCDGCCTVDGVCVPGNTATACGSGGVACSACLAGQICSAQACQATGDAGIEADGGNGSAGGNQPDGGVDSDGGTQPDGGVDPDGGAQSDGGVDPDAGSQADGGLGPDAGSQPDGGVAPDAGTPPSGALPIVAPAETWTWVNFPDAVCGNGTATGLAVNLTSASNDVFIFMDGGGACWDELTCFGFPPLLDPTAPRVLTGYGSADFFSSGYTGKFAVTRTQPANPFRNMSYVFIPYCTGDVHAGDAIQKYGSHPDVYHKGAKNVEAFLKRMVPTFPNATRIFLAGSSGGAFGAQLNYEQVATAFPMAEVHVFADSGQMINPTGTLLTTWLTNWNVTLPAGCVGCTNDFTLYPAYLSAQYPNRRFALTAYDQDMVLRNFFACTAAEFQSRTLALLASAYDPYPNAKYFVLSGTAHTMLDQLETIAAPSGMTLNRFTTDFVNGAQSWSSVKP
jgi:hypothetical protein